MNVIKYSVLTAGLFVIARNDLKYRRIANRLLAVLFVCRMSILIPECVICRETARFVLKTSISGLFLGSSLLLCCYLCTKGGMGGGDVKLFAVIGFFLGSKEVFIVLCITVGLAFIYCVTMAIFRKFTLANTIPFAPFALGGVLVLLLYKICCLKIGA